MAVRRASQERKKKGGTIPLSWTSDVTHASQGSDRRADHPPPSVDLIASVSNVDFINFTGVVHIVAVQDSIDLPETHVVPLLHLFPTVQQDSDTINIENTANCLDQFR
uniref:Uncharacterized protein n=2 Tax=Timema TaxID=61471 RepID=A0A7R9AVL1_TIMSH|nr:unnamed protein product [Timema shepardi]